MFEKKTEMGEDKSADGSCNTEKEIFSTGKEFLGKLPESLGDLDKEIVHIGDGDNIYVTQQVGGNSTVNNDSAKLNKAYAKIKLLEEQLSVKEDFCNKLLKEKEDYINEIKDTISFLKKENEKQTQLIKELTAKIK